MAKSSDEDPPSTTFSISSLTLLILKSIRLHLWEIITNGPCWPALGWDEERGVGLRGNL